MKKFEVPSYDDILGRYNREQVADYRATWPNGNDPDGETQVAIYVHGSVELGGFALEVDDNDNGGSSREAGEDIYPTFEAAKAAAVKFAEEHDTFANLQVFKSLEE